MMKRSGLPKYVTWVFVNGKRYARGRKHGKGYYFKHAPGTEEFVTEYQQWLLGHGSERQGIRGTKPGSVSALIAKYLSLRRMGQPLCRHSVYLSRHP
jgi:hypothetical protein